jgi:hypothetical protein
VKYPWLCPLVGIALVSGAAAGEGKKPSRVYTNEDLDRLAPYRGQTGVLNAPAAETPGAQAAEAGPDEAYWRREAARVRERVGALREKAEAIRREMREAREAAQSEPWTSRGPRRAAPKTASREAELAAIERRITALEVDLADRARAARALPGWLR